MGDEEKEKQEKLAAAKKRFEQLKKEQQKKGKKGAAKKKDDKATKDSEAKAEEPPEAAEEPSEGTTDGVEAEEPASNAPDPEEAEDDARTPSVSEQSKQRSESFRQGTSGPGAEVQELYKKQAARIEELEKENKTVREQQEEGATRWKKAEEELESLREGISDVAELRSKAKEADRLSGELETVKRQLSQAQQEAKSKRRQSIATPDVSAQLDSKTSTIESLELELSNLRNQVNGLQSTISERDASAKDLEEKAKAAETATESYKQELDQLKVSMTFPSADTQAAGENPEALTKRVTVLESDLRTANSNLDAAQQRATSLEQKIETLTKLHREVTASAAAKDRELADLRAQLKRHDRPSHVRDASDFELGEEEGTETSALQAKIRALEAENFDLRRGVWRDRRAELQPGMEDHVDAGYEDVDLNGPYSPQGRGTARQTHSSFQDVITSGISAFTGRPIESFANRRTSGSQKVTSPVRHRAESLGLLDDEGGAFDEEAWRLAQEEDAKRRVERVKEVKRGLDQWKGWRVDLTGLRNADDAGGFRGRMDVGPVFEV